MNESVHNPGNPVGITILDKQYLINCRANEQASLHAAAACLNEKMREIKQNGGVIGAERIAVMTALNLAAELLAYKKKNEDYTVRVNDTLKRLQNKINDAVIRAGQSAIKGPVSGAD